MSPSFTVLLIFVHSIKFRVTLPDKSTLFVFSRESPETAATILSSRADDTITDFSSTPLPFGKVFKSASPTFTPALPIFEICDFIYSAISLFTKTTHLPSSTNIFPTVSRSIPSDINAPKKSR